MSHQIITSDWFGRSELSDRQQEVLVGGVNYQLKDNNFSQGVATTTKTNNSSPEGNTSESNTQLADISSNAVSFLFSKPTELSVPPALNN
ncbi:CTB family bacteriocin [Umezakia ovalisporum]|jgi:hypothetical protein|uniref:CTB family bacteriocin n=1 Tax=Umezakia ovalisporum TaxID=75695 RepID=UPI002475573A|nr:CTB family bacteriocin [Umezakia ovalisporum]MBI1241435.1 hypothetical protein [Nostoc sp. RI_552]MDH6085849.1 CTB family bacteriocin [Umezakia ovalisporum TAC611]MDH6087274.1 CTB family bacteriocin [Umezakia ovalisporum Ak1311]